MSKRRFAQENQAPENNMNSTAAHEPAQYDSFVAVHLRTVMSLVSRR